MDSSPSSSSRKYDVFLSFRGEDTRKTFVDHLYSALKSHLINAFKDDDALPRGEAIAPSLLEAIKESKIAVVVLSKNYANSSWCLDELQHIMECSQSRGLTVMPVFYDVEPTEVRHQTGPMLEAFERHDAKDFAKAKQWRTALYAIGNNAGWVLKNTADGHESKFIELLIKAISKCLTRSNSGVDEDLVGMSDRLQQLESILSNTRQDDVLMVGICGMGGGGKTTLATSFCMKFSQQFQGHCVMENVREKTSKCGLDELQKKILSTFFKNKEEVDVQGVAEGKQLMKQMLSNRKVLLLLDDVDKLDQLEALAGKHDWFGSGSRIIITTRDEHLLRTHRIDQIYHVTLLSSIEANQLFKKHAYNDKDPIEDYTRLSSCVVSYAAGLPLALKVLGSFLYDKSQNEWQSTLEKLKHIPQMDIQKALKISYDGLTPMEKELFLDIACFATLRQDMDDTMLIMEACGFHPEIGIKVLRQKSLITTYENNWGRTELKVHDLLKEMARYIVRGEHPRNPEKHSRVWNNEDIEIMCLGDATVENDKTEAIVCHVDKDHASSFINIVPNMKKLRYLDVNMCDYRNHHGPIYPPNGLLYMNWNRYPTSTPFADSFQPTNLVVLSLGCSNQKELWKGNKYLPHLRVLELRSMKLLSTPDVTGLPCLQRLQLYFCNDVEEIHRSVGNCTNLECLDVSHCPKIRRFPQFAQMKNLTTLRLENCGLNDGDIPSDIGNLSNLQELLLNGNGFSHLDINLSQLTHLIHLDVSDCQMLLALPELPPSLVTLEADSCDALKTIGDYHKNCKWLCQLSLSKCKFGIVSGSEHLLQPMLEGNAIENGPIFLRFSSYEIPMEIKPPPLIWSRCTLKIPKTTWCDEYSGFLMCVLKEDYHMRGDFITVRVTKVLSDISSEDDVVWKKANRDYMNTILWWYIPFDSLRHTTWWEVGYNMDQAYNALSFEIADKEWQIIGFGFGVRLLDRKSRSGETSADPSSHIAKKSRMDPSSQVAKESSYRTAISTDYTPKIKIIEDSACNLTIKSSVFKRRI